MMNTGPRIRARLAAAALLPVAIASVAEAQSNPSGACRGAGIEIAVDASGAFTPDGARIVGALETSFGGAAAVNLLVLNVQPNPDGSFTFRAVGQWDFGDGEEILVTDFVTLTPSNAPGIFDVESTSFIVGGTGIYQSACGPLHTTGVADLATGEAIWSITGILRFRPPHGDAP